LRGIKGIGAALQRKILQGLAIRKTIRKLAMERSR
jgi:hypothetical protein